MDNLMNKIDDALRAGHGDHLGVEHEGGREARERKSTTGGRRSLPAKTSETRQRRAPPLVPGYRVGRVSNAECGSEEADDSVEQTGRGAGEVASEASEGSLSRLKICDDLLDDSDANTEDGRTPPLELTEEIIRNLGISDAPSPGEYFAQARPSGRSSDCLASAVFHRQQRRLSVITELTENSTAGFVTMTTASCRSTLNVNTDKRLSTGSRLRHGASGSDGGALADTSVRSRRRYSERKEVERNRAADSWGFSARRSSMLRGDIDNDAKENGEGEPEQDDETVAEEADVNLENRSVLKDYLTDVSALQQNGHGNVDRIIHQRNVPVDGASFSANTSSVAGNVILNSEADEAIQESYRLPDASDPAGEAATRDGDGFRGRSPNSSTSQTGRTGAEGFRQVEIGMSSLSILDKDCALDDDFLFLARETQVEQPQLLAENTLNTPVRHQRDVSQILGSVDRKHQFAADDIEKILGTSTGNAKIGINAKRAVGLETSSDKASVHKHQFAADDIRKILGTSIGNTKIGINAKMADGLETSSDKAPVQGGAMSDRGDSSWQWGGNEFRNADALPARSGRSSHGEDRQAGIPPRTAIAGFRWPSPQDSIVDTQPLSPSRHNAEAGVLPTPKKSSPTLDHAKRYSQEAQQAAGAEGGMEFGRANSFGSFGAETDDRGEPAVGKNISCPDGESAGENDNILSEADMYFPFHSGEENAGQEEDLGKRRDRKGSDLWPTLSEASLENEASILKDDPVAHDFPAREDERVTVRSEAEAVATRSGDFAGEPACSGSAPNGVHPSPGVFFQQKSGAMGDLAGISSARRRPKFESPAVDSAVHVQHTTCKVRKTRDARKLFSPIKPPKGSAIPVRQDRRAPNGTVTGKDPPSRQETAARTAVEDKRERASGIPRNRFPGGQRRSDQRGLSRGVGHWGGSDDAEDERDGTLSHAANTNERESSPSASETGSFAPWATSACIGGCKRMTFAISPKNPSTRDHCFMPRTPLTVCSDVAAVDLLNNYTDRDLRFWLICVGSGFRVTPERGLLPPHGKRVTVLLQIRKDADGRVRGEDSRRKRRQADTGSRCDGRNFVVLMVEGASLLTIPVIVERPGGSRR